MNSLSIFNGNSLLKYEEIRTDLIKLISKNLDIVSRYDLMRELVKLVKFRIDPVFSNYRSHVNFLNSFLPNYGFSIICDYIAGSSKETEQSLIDCDKNLKLFKKVFEDSKYLVSMSNYFPEDYTIEYVYNGYVPKALIDSRLARSKEFFLILDFGDNVTLHPVLRFYKICCILGWDLHECTKYAHLVNCDYVPMDIVDKISSMINIEVVIDSYRKTQDGAECLVIYLANEGELYNPYFILPLDGESFCYIDSLRCLPTSDSLKDIIELVFSTKVVNLRPLSDLSRLCLHGYTSCRYPKASRFKELTNASYAGTMSIERTSNLTGINQEACMQLIINLMDYIVSDEYDKTYCYHFFNTFIEDNLINFIFSENNKALLRLYVSVFCINYLNYICRICLNYLYMEDRAYVMSEQYEHENYTQYMLNGKLIDSTSVKDICRTLLCMSKLDVKSLDVSTLSDMVSTLNYVTNNRLLRIKMMTYMLGVKDCRVADIKDDKFEMEVECFGVNDWDQTFKLVGDCLFSRVPLVAGAGYRNTSRVIQAGCEERFRFYLNMFFTSKVKSMERHLNSSKLMSPSSRVLHRTYLIDEFLLLDIGRTDDASGYNVYPVRWMPYSYNYKGEYVQCTSGNRFELLKQNNGCIVGRQLPTDINLQRTSLFTN